jgi:CMP-N-acetylneuraminic acid synthetase
MDEKITAIIGVRKGSIRVKNKNIKPFGDTTLLELKIKTLLDCQNIDNILVTSDCDEMLELAKKYDVIVHKRDKYYASNECPTSEYFKYIAGICDTEHIIYSPVTSPFITSNDYDNIINIYKSFNLNKKYDSITTCEKLHEFIYLNNNPLNFKSNNIPKSQDIEGILKLTFGCSILPKKIMIENKYILGNKPYFYDLNDNIKNLDIDTSSDFMICELLYKNNILSEKSINI